MDRSTVKRVPWVHLVLFLATLVSVHAAGVMWEGIAPWEQPWELWRGYPFALPLLLILGTHEMGHYVVARRYGVSVTLPYFIPAPTMIGTFGAVIRMRSLPPHRRALLDIGIAGPLAGLAVTILVLYMGLLQCQVVTRPPDAGLEFGEPLLFQLMSWLRFGKLPEGHTLMIGPVAFAGWVGLFITALNLLPIGQLDGGHVLYAVSGPAHRLLSMLLLGVMVVFGFVFWTGWLFMAVLGFLAGALRPHPPAYAVEGPVDVRDRLLALLALAVFALSFVLEPVKVL